MGPHRAALADQCMASRGGRRRPAVLGHVPAAALRPAARPRVVTEPLLCRALIWGWGRRAGARRPYRPVGQGPARRSRPALGSASVTGTLSAERGSQRWAQGGHPGDRRARHAAVPGQSLPRGRLPRGPGRAGLGVLPGPELDERGSCGRRLLRGCHTRPRWEPRDGVRVTCSQVPQLNTSVGCRGEGASISYELRGIDQNRRFSESRARVST